MKLLETLDGQISDADATYDEIMTRYGEQKLLLESIQSELLTEKEYADALKLHRNQLDEEMKDLKGILHPIRRCPMEILRYIFEDTFIPRDRYERVTKLQQATWLSHVCQHWRTIVLNTPSLWIEISVNFAQEPSAVRAYWKRAVDRVKSLPATVRLYNIGGTDEKTPRGRWEHREEQEILLTFCNLEEVPFISSLEFEIAEGLPIQDALAWITKFPSGNLDHLAIKGYNSEQPGRVGLWDWSTFLHRFPPFETLELDTLGFITFSPSTPFTSLTELNITDVFAVNILELLRSCPNVAELVVGPCWEGNGTLSVPLTMPALTSLQVYEHPSFPWSGDITFPRLSTLSIWNYNYDRLSEEAIGFIARHPSITNIGITVKEPLLERLADVAPQLTELAVSSEKSSIRALIDWRQADLSGPAFPRLKLFDLQLEYGDTIGLADFETLVSKRCLPLSHEDSQLEEGVRPLKYLTIKLPIGHARSRYMASATTQLMDERVTGLPSNGKISLRWR